MTAPAAWATEDPVVDALVEKLVERGMLSREDAAALVRERTISPAAKGAEPVAGAGDGAAGSGGTEKAKGKGESKQKLPFDLKVRMQARLDSGDLLVGPDDRYRTESDLYLRRVRLEIDKKLSSPPIGKKLDFNLTLEADRFEQDLRGGARRDPGNDVGLQYVYLDWTFAEPFAVQVGKRKLPMLRTELTSSSRQLFIERPASTTVAKDLLGDFHQAHVMAHGDAFSGVLRYYLSLFDGAANLDYLQEIDEDATSMAGRRAGKAFVGRVELALLPLLGADGLVESKRDDTGIGTDTHLTLGIDGGFQNGIDYATDAVPDASLDSSIFSVDLAGRCRLGTAGTLTAQAEYLNFRREFNYRPRENPQGGYLQGGYLLAKPLLHGLLEPALRYEVFDHDRVENAGAGGSRERTLSVGFNHYLLQHTVKWSYNFAHTRFDAGVAEAPASSRRDLHQLMLQLYF